MATRRLFDGATIEIGQIPIVSAAPPPAGGTKLWLKVSGVWKESTVWIKVSGVWKTATPFFKESSIWK